MTSLFSKARRSASRLLKRDKVNVVSAMGRGSVVEIVVEGHHIRWLITNTGDEIQSKQIGAGFYELSELLTLARDVGSVRSVLDVGANVGNHAVFFIKVMGARSLTLVEPYAPAAAQLLANLALNADDVEEVRLHRCALGSTSGSARIIPPSAFNIGLTRIKQEEGSKSDVVVRKGDDLRITDLDLIKIDVEGGELGVLEGLEQTIRRFRPAIYVETSSGTKTAVEGFLANLSYRVVRCSEAYHDQFNLTLVTAEAS